MFDFEKLDVYQLTHTQNVTVLKMLYEMKNLDRDIHDQWKRASMSSLLNLAEGVGRMTPADKKHFITVSRGSIFECVAILLTVRDLGVISKEESEKLYATYEQISKMLLGLFRNVEPK